MDFNCKFMSAFLCPLLLSSICFVSLVESINNGGVTVDLIHRDSPHSPSYDSSTTRFQRQRSAFDRAFARKATLASSLSSSLDSNIEAPVTRGGGEYLMKIEIGTPAVEQLGIADTGSDLTWSQCQPCTHCYNQNLPIFDPSRSSSYRPISCESEQCSAASGAASCGVGNTCQYRVRYGDKSYSIGDLAAETLTIGGGVSFPNVAFGCGHENDGTFSQTGSGIVGLGGGPISIVNQLKSSIGGKFSYCLSASANVSSKISFGSNAAVGGSGAVSTPLVRKSPATFYYLTLLGVSVGAEKVELNGNEAEKVELNGNIIIDSGTTLTFIPSGLYDGLESALEKAITGTRAWDPRGTFKLCYQSRGELSVPSLTAHFEGADVVLPNIFVEVEEGVVCFALVPSQDLVIFGNLQQINYQIGYDLVKGEVTFKPTDCSIPQ